MTTPDIINFVKQYGLTSTDSIFGDSSRPETIQEIFNDGYNIYPCKKGVGSVKSGIDWIKRHKIYIHRDSVNFLKEIKSYKWKVNKDEKVLDEPVDVNNHLLDALRYAMTSKMEVQEDFFIASSLSVRF
jgi:phage terminase large subunit